MIHCSVPINVPRFQADDGGFELFFFGDRQEGSPGYIPDAWEAFRDEFKRCKRKKAAIGLGDYGDWLRPSLRPALRGALGKDDSARRMLDKSILTEHDKIIRAHDFLEGYVIGLHEGHHNWTTLDAINLDQRLSSALKARFLGFAAGTRLVLRQEFSYGSRLRKNKNIAPLGGYVVTLLSTHGNANGRRVPGALSWVENNLANAFLADLYVIGHGCKSGNDAPFERTEIRRNGTPGLKRSIPRIMAVGGFARGWTDGWRSDYVEQSGMSPQPLGWGKILFRLVKGKDRALARGCAGRGTLSLDIEAANRFYTVQDDDVHSETI